MPTLEQRIAALEAAIAGLQGSEALNPNYLTVTPGGQVGASFTGQVHAQGLILDAATTNTPPTQDKIRWLLQASGALVADLAGYSFGGISNAKLQSFGVAPGDQAGVAMEAFPGSNGSSSAFVAGIADPVTDANTFTSVTATDHTGASNFAKLLDALGRSSFIGTAGLAAKQLSLDAGSVNINFPNSQNATAVNVAHGLGRIPTAIGFGVTDIGIAVAIYPAWSAKTAAQFTLGAHCTAILNQNVAIDWIAVG